MLKKTRLIMLAIVAVMLATSFMPLAMAKEKLTIWSHWADETPKKEFVQAAIDKFKAKNPTIDVEVVWYQKPALMQALTTSFAAGTGPDIFYLEPVITGLYPDFVSKGLMFDLTKYVDKYIDKGALGISKYNKMTYLIPLEAYMPMLYFNKDILSKAGVKIPSAGKFTMEELTDAVKKVKAAGYTPFSCGTMDRNWQASILLESVLMRYIGQEKWQGIAKGATSWNDPDVVKSIKYVENLVKLGAYPEGVASIKLGESHSNFWAPGSKYAMFPMKTFFGGRAFVPVEKGGMAPDFPLGIMDMPIDKANKAKANSLSYIQIGGSYGVYSGSKNAKKAAELLAIMAQMGDVWMTKAKGQTGLKTNVAKLDDPYFKTLGAAAKGLSFIPGAMELNMEAGYLTAFMTYSTALVTNQISAEEMIKKLEEARAKLPK